MPALTNSQFSVETDGFAIVEDVLTATAADDLICAMQRLGDSISLRKRGGIFAVRNLLDLSPEVRELAKTTSVRNLVEPVLGPRAFPVRGILFDKIPDANWKVPWHQDVTIAVQRKTEIDGWGPWSVKADVVHVQPPVWILEQMLSVRLHLDPCSEANGALRVLPGTHLHGRIAETEIPLVRDQVPEHICSVERGGALLMRPLLLHASSPSTAPGHRRVIHLDYASADLPSGLRWFSEPQGH